MSVEARLRSERRLVDEENTHTGRFHSAGAYRLCTRSRGMGGNGNHMLDSRCDDMDLVIKEFEQ